MVKQFKISHQLPLLVDRQSLEGLINPQIQLSHLYLSLNCLYAPAIYSRIMRHFLELAMSQASLH